MNHAIIKRGKKSMSNDYHFCKNQGEENNGILLIWFTPKRTEWLGTGMGERDFIT